MSEQSTPLPTLFYVRHLLASGSVFTRISIGNPIMLPDRSVQAEWVTNSEHSEEPMFMDWSRIEEVTKKQVPSSKSKSILRAIGYDVPESESDSRSRWPRREAKITASDVLNYVKNHQENGNGYFRRDQLIDELNEEFNVVEKTSKSKVSDAIKRGLIFVVRTEKRPGGGYPYEYLSSLPPGDSDEIEEAASRKPKSKQTPAPIDEKPKAEPVEPEPAKPEPVKAEPPPEPAGDIIAEIREPIAIPAQKTKQILRDEFQIRRKEYIDQMKETIERGYEIDLDAMVKNMDERFEEDMRNYQE